MKHLKRFLCLCCGAMAVDLLLSRHQFTRNFLGGDTRSDVFTKIETLEHGNSSLFWKNLTSVSEMMQRDQFDKSFLVHDYETPSPQLNRPELIVEGLVDREQSDRALLVLHVGPTKTGTTTIQSKLESSRFAETALKDNYTVVHFEYLLFEELLKDCFNKGKDCDEGRSWKKLLTIYNESTAITNAIHSCETFSFIPNDEYTFKRLRSLQKHYNVRVIVTYRAAHEWLVSAYHQHEKYKFYKPLAGRWRNFQKTPSRISFREYFARNFDHVKDSYHVRNLYAMIFGESAVTVMPMPKDGKLLSQFFCHTLPNGNNTCSHSQEREKRKKRVANPSSHFLFDHDLLIERARDLLPEAIKSNLKQRHNATVLLEERLKQMNLTTLDMPQECLTPEQLQMLWNYTWMVEQSMAPSPFDYDTFYKSFHRSIFKFCSVDVHTTLQNETWRDIFLSIA